MATVETVALLIEWTVYMRKKVNIAKISGPANNAQQQRYNSQYNQYMDQACCTPVKNT